MSSSLRHYYEPNSNNPRGMSRRTTALVLVVGLLVGVIVLGLSSMYGSAANKNQTTTVHFKTSTHNKNNNPRDDTDGKNTIRVLCYGDSLTAGMSPPGLKLFPYSNYLQTTLIQQSNANANTDADANANANVSYQVDHIGLAGWTTTHFLNTINDEETGLQRTLVDYSSSSLLPLKNNNDRGQLVILLAGTNDIPRVLRDAATAIQNEGGDPRDSSNVIDKAADQLTHNLLQLHQTAMTSGAFHTVAIGIPSSAFQAKIAAASQLVDQVNDNLQFYAAQHAAICTYQRFPFPYQLNGENWSPDGLHFSPQGYHVLGEALAPTVQKIVHQYFHNLTS